MFDFSNFGRLLMFIGGIMLLVGAVIAFGGKFIPFGKLPGDIYFQKGNFSFYFPVVTSIVISIILTLVLNFLFRK